MRQIAEGAARLIGADDGPRVAALAFDGWDTHATEFGRTARVNGTTGADHGTDTIALLVGGAVNGGRVLADWPGLRLENLHEGRDLRPTTDLRAVAKGVVADLFGVSAPILD